MPIKDKIQTIKDSTAALGPLSSSITPVLARVLDVVDARGMSYDLQVFALGGATDADARFEELLAAAEHQTGTTPSRRAADAEAAVESRGLRAVQVSFDGELATLTIPYWDSWDRRGIGQEIRLAASVLAAAGYDTVLDPQLGRTLNLETDLDQVLEKFEDGIALTRALAAGQPGGEIGRPAPSRPRRWWRRRQ